MSAKKVVVIGSLNYDIIVKQDRMPLKGETFTGNDLVQGPGGKGSNQAAECALLGLNTSMIGKVGDDRFGEALIGSLKASGVDTSHIKKFGITGLGLVHVMPDGDYYSTIIKGANYLITKDDIYEAKDMIQEADYLILQQEIPECVTEYIIEEFGDSPIYLILNNAPAKNIKNDLLNKIDMLIVNESEVSFMINQEIQTYEEAINAATKLRELVKDTVIVTLGSKGSVAVNKNEVLTCSAEKVEAIDASGAGDSYIGGIVYGLVNNMSLEDSMIFASKVGAITVTRNGGQDSFPTIEEVNKALKEKNC